MVYLIRTVILIGIEFYKSLTPTVIRNFVSMLLKVCNSQLIALYLMLFVIIIIIIIYILSLISRVYEDTSSVD